MTNHDLTLAMIDEKLERLQVQLRQAQADLHVKETAVNRAQQEVKLINFSIMELENSKSLLRLDASHKTMPAG